MDISITQIIKYELRFLNKVLSKQLLASAAQAETPVQEATGKSLKKDLIFGLRCECVDRQLHFAFGFHQR